MDRGHSPTALATTSGTRTPAHPDGASASGSRPIDGQSGGLARLWPVKLDLIGMRSGISQRLVAALHLVCGPSFLLSFWFSVSLSFAQSYGLGDVVVDRMRQNINVYATPFSIPIYRCWSLLSSLSRKKKIRYHVIKHMEDVFIY